MNPIDAETSDQSAYGAGLFRQRVEGYKAARDPHAYQAAQAASFL